MYRADGTVVLTDFGIAKEIAAATTGLTATGAAIGTPTYMSPNRPRAKILTVARISTAWAWNADNTGDRINLISRQTPNRNSRNVAKAVTLRATNPGDAAKPIHRAQKKTEGVNLRVSVLVSCANLSCFIPVQCQRCERLFVTVGKNLVMSE